MFGIIIAGIGLYIFSEMLSEFINRLLGPRPVMKRKWSPEKNAFHSVWEWE